MYVNKGDVLNSDPGKEMGCLNIRKLRSGLESNWEVEGDKSQFTELVWIMLRRAGYQAGKRHVTGGLANGTRQEKCGN